MDRSSFGTRAKQRMWQDVRDSAKGRVIPFSIGAIGIVLGFLINLLWLHVNTAKQLAVLSAVSLIGSYVIWFLGAFVVSAFRAPWLLDAESHGLINSQETRAEIAEKKLSEIEAAREKHDLFGQLMHEGVELSDQIAGCQIDPQFAYWDRLSNDWIKSVQQAMRDMGLPTDAVEFARAAEYAEPVRDVVTAASMQEERARVLEKHQENLADFVRRRLS